MERTTTWKITSFAGVFLLALVTGVFWGTWFTLTRSLETFSVAEFVHIGQIIIRNVAWPMRLLTPACIFFMILWAWLVPDKKSTAFFLGFVAGSLVAIALLITLLVEVPIDNQIGTWSVQTIPADWTELRARWQIFHAARTFVSLSSLATLILAVSSCKQQRGITV
jgi:hypothetical protein